MVCPHLDPFRCGSLCTLGLSSSAPGPCLSDYEGALGTVNMSGTCGRMVNSLLYPPGLIGVAWAEGQMSKGHWPGGRGMLHGILGGGEIARAREEEAG